jgi:Outer membrane protein beta-barrel domain
MKKIAFYGILVGVAGTLCAQETPRFSYAAGAGFSTPVGTTSNKVDTGWNVRGSAGVNFSPYVGAMVDVGYDSLGISSPVLNNLGFGGGSLTVFSATLNPIVHLMPRSSTDIYLTGGGGYFRQNQDFTQPGVASGVGFDRFFGFFPFSTPVNVIVSSYSVNKPGIDVGAGISFGKKWGGKFFAEARYNRIFIGDRHTDYIPVSFGFRR